jgi:hypothetical protein
MACSGVTTWTRPAARIFSIESMPCSGDAESGVALQRA